MGVRLLQTFIETSVKNGTKHIDIKSEVEKYKSENDGKEPLILIDLLAINRLFFTYNQEIILGGRYNVYNDRVNTLFVKLKALGVKLVFFTDGPTSEGKLPTCLARRKENYEKAMSALGCIYANRDLSNCLENFDMQPPVPMFSTLNKLASSFGHVFICVLNECDTEIADYATKHNALAVISNDSDFLIFKGKWKLWSSRVLNANYLTTTEYNREVLRRSLRLNSDQMPLLATMCGNDYVPYDTDFHKHTKLKALTYSRTSFDNRNVDGGRFHFPAVASEIRNLGIMSSTISEEEANLIEKLIFNKGSQRSGKDLIQSSLKFYDYAQMTREHETELMKKMSQYDGRMNYILLANIKYIVQLHYFDLSKPDLKPFFEIISPLLSRIMGIILSHEANASRTFYCKLNMCGEYEPIVLQSDCPPCDIPPLESLVFEKIGADPELDKTRLELICWQISPSLTPDKIKTLPSAKAADAITLLYLVELKQISEEEADCLLLACNCPNDMKYSLNLSDMKSINGRDARIAFLFTIVEVYIKNCFYAVGWETFCRLITFDGLYFHHLRKKWNTLDKASMLKPIETLRLYAS